MFEDKISVYESFTSEPKTITLMQWLKACKNGSRFTEKVLKYRLTKEDSLKKSLPFVTVGAVFSSGRKIDKMVSHTGWIALDIDSKDNPKLKDAEHLRNEVAKIQNVAFAGLSTGGAGIWALVKVSNPDKQAEHFEMLKKDFEHFRITLDTTKGKNPNDARFYSYDPGAIIKDSFTVYTKLPPFKKDDVSNKTIDTPHYNLKSCYSYSEKAFTNEIEILSRATKGNRNISLFKCSASLAELVTGRMLEEQKVKQAIEQTALSIGLKIGEITSTLKSGFNAGYKNPRTPDSIKQNRVHIDYSLSRDNRLETKYESRNLAPNGFNHSKVEMCDDRGYPASWDEIEAPEPGTMEYIEAENYMFKDYAQKLEVITNMEY